MIIVIMMIVVAVFLYMIMIGSNLDKTLEIQKREDEEQLKYIRDYCNGGNDSEKSK